MHSELRSAKMVAEESEPCTTKQMVDIASVGPFASSYRILGILDMEALEFIRCRVPGLKVYFVQQEVYISLYSFREVHSTSLADVQKSFVPVQPQNE